MPLTDHPLGNYRFLPGIAPYSCGVVSNPGFEIVHVTCQRPISYRRGFDDIAKYLETHGHPKTALCGIELRSPKPFTFAGFSAFNAEYASILKQWGLFVDGVNPVARTNVASVLRPPGEPVLYGFSFTKACPTPDTTLVVQSRIGGPLAPALRGEGWGEGICPSRTTAAPMGDYTPTFVVAGAGELPEGVLSRDEIVALGDTSHKGLIAKSRFVMGLMESRLVGLGVEWSMVNTINVYTEHSLTALIDNVILARVGSASVHGATWHFSRPPIEEIEFEMDVRGTNTNVFWSRESD